MKNCVFVHISRNQITNKKVIAQAFKVLEDGKYLITIEDSKHRSNPQNKYYWGCMLPLIKDGLKENGYREVKTNEDAHEVVKYLFLKKKFPNEETGEVIELLGSTAKLSTREFNEYIDEIIQWAVEFLGVQIPLPNEQMQLL